MREKPGLKLPLDRGQVRLSYDTSEARVLRGELLLDSSNSVQGLGESVVACVGGGFFEVYEPGKPFFLLGVADQRGNDAFVDPVLGIRISLGAVQILRDSTCSGEPSRQ
ncbi:hypothetical protein ABT218_20580 [Streptomyces sp. NPDC001455]|uniref:hypothetical protein n=1 Tax=unclassified Streptomyces TaxID=2593676 RepID=UPI003319AFFC